MTNRDVKIILFSTFFFFLGQANPFLPCLTQTKKRARQPDKVVKNGAKVKADYNLTTVCDGLGENNASERAASGNLVRKGGQCTDDDQPRSRPITWA